MNAEIGRDRAISQQSFDRREPRLPNHFGKIFFAAVSWLMEISPSLRFTIWCRVGARADRARGGCIPCPLMTIPRWLGLLARGLDGRIRGGLVGEGDDSCAAVPLKGVFPLTFFWQDVEPRGGLVVGGNLAVVFEDHGR